MRNIYCNIIDYQEFHPFKTWIIIINLIILCITFIYIFKKILDYYTKKTKGNSNYSETIYSRIKNFIKKPKIATVIITSQFIIIIVLISLITIFYNSTNSRTENPFLSSSKYTFGIDISHYQGKIKWDEMRTSHHPIEFVFIRSTMGVDGVDKEFKKNWEKAKEHNYVRGAYHYYRPNQNSTKQFENYKSQVTIQKGDFIPILDIEKESKFGRKNLRIGVLNWLKLAEKEYGVKPMIYTGLKFYQDILKGYVDKYPLWIAAYSGKNRVRNEKWTFHQFTEKVVVKGIKTSVDGNDFNGDIKDLKKMCK